MLTGFAHVAFKSLCAIRDARAVHLWKAVAHFEDDFGVKLWCCYEAAAALAPLISITLLGFSCRVYLVRLFMDTPILISIVGAASAFAVSLLSAWFSNKNNIVLQIRKLKEEHYVSYIEALHNLVADNHEVDVIAKYVLARDKLFLIADENVITSMIAYENEGVGKPSQLHDEMVTNLIKAIRQDLKLKDRNFPIISLKKAPKSA